MNILAIGGATQDIFMTMQGSDTLTISKKGSSINYLLFESGEKLEIDTLTLHSGGGATNSSVSFKRLGFQTSIFCTINNDAAGKQITEELTKEGVNTDLININSQEPTGKSFILNAPNNTRTVLVHRGANTTLDLSALPINAIKESNQLYITSLSNNAAKALSSITAAAKQYGIPVAINPGASQLAKGTLLLKESLRNIDTLIMNSSEARIFMAALAATDDFYKEALESGTTNSACTLNVETNTPYLIQSSLLCQNQYFSMHKFFKETLKMGPKIVVVTNGANGVYVAHQDTIYFHPSKQTNTVNTVGAGDAFGSCFVASMHLGYSIPDALRNGIVNSSSVLEHLGAKTGLLTHDQLKAHTKDIIGHAQTFTL